MNLDQINLNYVSKIRKSVDLINRYLDKEARDKISHDFIFSDKINQDIPVILNYQLRSCLNDMTLEILIGVLRPIGKD